LPSGFALPAGLGDVAIGLAAPWVANNLLVGKPYAIKAARLWNYLGIFDLVLAITMGVTHSNTPLAGTARLFIAAGIGWLLVAHWGFGLPALFITVTAALAISAAISVLATISGAIWRVAAE
jgi:hypothetical protein